MKNYVVYIHRFPNRKVYIGITSQKVERRWNNGHGYKGNKYMTNAIMKYGWNNIKHDVLFANLTKFQAEKIEKDLIKIYKSNQREFGYNILDGGNVSNGLSIESIQKMSLSQKKLWQNAEHRKHMSDVHKGKKASEETKKKMSLSNNRYWLGKQLPEEAIIKMKNKLKGREVWNKGTKGIMKPNKTSFKKGEVHSITKKVMCIEIGIIYNSINEASRTLNINSTCIVNACKGKQMTAGGYHWKYIQGR